MQCLLRNIYWKKYNSSTTAFFEITLPATNACYISVKYSSMSSYPFIYKYMYNTCILKSWQKGTKSAVKRALRNRIGLRNRKLNIVDGWSGYHKLILASRFFISDSNLDHYHRICSSLRGAIILHRTTHHSLYWRTIELIELRTKYPVRNFLTYKEYSVPYFQIQ